MRLRILTVLVLLVLGLGAAAYVVFDPPAGSAASSQYLTAQATRTNVVEQAVATGSVAAHATYGLGFGRDAALIPSGSTASGATGTGTWVVTAIDVKLGDRVTKGTVLATSDDTDARLALQIAQADLAAAQSKLDTDQGGPTAAEKATAQNTLVQAQEQLKNAKQSQTDTKRQNDLSLSNAHSAVNTAKKQLASDRSASAPSTVISADKTALRQARQSLASTEAQVSASNHQAQQNVTSATLSVSTAENNYTTSVAPATDATIAADKASLATAQQASDAAQAALDHASITAPVDGVIVAINAEPGLAAPSGDTVAIEVGPMEVSAQFAEADLPSLKIGQDATVTVTALGQDLTGKVSQITPVAATTGSSSVVTYAITVTLTTSPDTVRSGMSANVAVTTASATGVLAIPAIALTGATGNYSVRVLDGSGQIQTVPVGVGLTTSTLAEITSGLTEGETVVTGSATARTGTTTTPNSGFGGFGGGAFPGGGVRVPGGGTSR
jgi:RND family efflux transporter MFP subunit